MKLHNPKKIIAIDVDENRLELVKKNSYADIVLNPLKVDIEKEILKYTEGRGADKVFEVAGGEKTFDLALKIARPNATVVLVAMYEKDQVLPLPNIYGKNLTIKFGGVDGCDCDKIMKYIEEKKIDATPLITHRMKFKDIMEAYEIFENKRDGVIKIAINMKE